MTRRWGNNGKKAWRNHKRMGAGRKASLSRVWSGLKYFWLFQNGYTRNIRKKYLTFFIVSTPVNRNFGSKIAFSQTLKTTFAPSPEVRSNPLLNRRGGRWYFGGYPSPNMVAMLSRWYTAISIVAICTTALPVWNAKIMAMDQKRAQLNSVRGYRKFLLIINRI